MEVRTRQCFFLHCTFIAWPISYISHIHLDTVLQMSPYLQFPKLASARDFCVKPENKKLWISNDDDDDAAAAAAVSDLKPQ